MRSFAFGGFHYDGLKRQLRDAAGALIELPARSCDALAFLLEHRGEDVSKDQLVKALWPSTIVEENNLNQAIFALRRALGDDASNPRFIMTLPGRGYRFIAELDAPALPPAPEPEPPAAPPPRKPPWPGIGVGAVLLITAIAFWLRPSPVDSPPASVAVLPFTALLPDQSDPALELGMTNTLITEIGALPGMRVSSLNAVRRAGEPGVEATTVGQRLGVEAVLESSILKQGERIRVSSRLLRVRDGQSLWAGQFDESLSDIFAVQDSIAERVMATLAPQLAARAHTKQPRPTENAEAYHLYASGFYQQQRRDVDGLPAAVEKYEAALLLDPGYVDAWGALSRTLAAQGVFGTRPPQSVLPRAKEAALRAVELDPESGAAHAALGHVLAVYDHRYKEAEEQYILAKQLEPGTPEFYLLSSINQMALGHTHQGLAEARRAMEIEPASLLFTANLGMLLYLDRSYDEAAAVLKRVVELQPRFDHARNFLGRTLLAQGDIDGALAQFAARTNPSPGSRADPARTYAVAGRRAEALAEAEKVKQLGRQGFGVGYDLAIIHAALGDIPEACRALESALLDRSATLGSMQLDPSLDALRAEPCFAEVARQLYDDPRR